MQERQLALIPRYGPLGAHKFARRGEPIRAAITCLTIKIWTACTTRAAKAEEKEFIKRFDVNNRPIPCTTDGICTPVQSEHGRNRSAEGEARCDHTQSNYKYQTRNEGGCSRSATPRERRKTCQAAPSESASFRLGQNESSKVNR
jgi:hypothetical protein